MLVGADLFCGLGGFTEGARQTGLVDVQFAANHWPEACEYHHLNHPGYEPVCQDLQQVDFGILPYLRDGILLAAPACQGHSQAGQPARKGTGGSHAPNAERLARSHRMDRSTAWAVIAATEAARPRAIIVENIPDFVNWELFKGWTGMLETLGYNLAVNLVNAADFGSPQSRERMILTGIRDHAPVEITPTRDRQRSIADCLDPDYHTDNLWHPIASKPDRMRPRIAKAQREAGERCFWNNVSESRGRHLQELAPTVTTQSGTQFCLVDGDRIRVLNRYEMARLQSFPDSTILPPQKGLSGELVGNAIDVRMARGSIEQVALAAAA